MPAKVTLKVTAGKLAGKELDFSERDTCLLGRGKDIPEKLRLPNDKDHRTISRTHCLLDINPPDVRIRDFGSLNGTYVNGEKIGQRPEGMSAEDGRKLEFSERDLKEGDKILLGRTTFQVVIFKPLVCRECTREIPDSKMATQINVPGAREYRCQDCAEKARLAKQKAPVRPIAKVCAHCGKEVAAEMGDRHGVYVCQSCRSAPSNVIQNLLVLARGGDKSLCAIKGYSTAGALGEGGFGTVYLARHEQTDEHVALKVLLPVVAADEEKKAMFLREVENTKALHHPNVIEYRDSGCSNGTFFLTLEYCDGGCVDKLLRQKGALAIDEAIPIVLQALDGLEYAHHAKIPYVKLADGTFGTGYGLVHRDIKPANLLLRGTGTNRLVKIADFGLSKAFDLAGLSGHSFTGLIAGTPFFMPRQQVVNFKYTKPDVDVWAMAATLYKMLTGATARDLPRGQDVWQTVLSTDARPILSRGVPIPKKLAKVIDEALVDKPDIQIKSAAEFKRALEGAV